MSTWKSAGDVRKESLSRHCHQMTLAETIAILSIITKGSYVKTRARGNKGMKEFLITRKGQIRLLELERENDDGGPRGGKMIPIRT